MSDADGAGLDSATRLWLRSSFDRAADVYAASRPSYPEEAVAWMLGAGTGHVPVRGWVLDLGAGSGALTQTLRAPGRFVAAAEPSHNLLLELRAADPTAPTTRAAAEQLPFTDRAFDLVTVATAFHWFDAARALPEIARVLRPGGHLCLVWNSRTTREPWTRALSELLRSAQPPALKGDWGTGSARALEGSVHFTAAQRADFEYLQQLDRQGVVDLVASRSYVIAMDPAGRDLLLERVRALFDSHAGPDGVLTLTYVTQCWRSAVRRPPVATRWPPKPLA